jgi:hypothetical protein
LNGNTHSEQCIKKAGGKPAFLFLPLPLRIYHWQEAWAFEKVC